MIQDIFFWLQFSALVLVHLLLIFGLIISIQIMFTIRKVNEKVEEVTETGKEAIRNITNAGESITSFLSPFSNRNQGTLLNVVANFFRKR